MPLYILGMPLGFEKGEAVSGVHHRCTGKTDVGSGGSVLGKPSPPLMVDGRKQPKAPPPPDRLCIEAGADPPKEGASAYTAGGETERDATGGERGETRCDNILLL